MAARGPFGGVRDSLAAALSTGELRRLHASWAASAVGSWVFFVTLAVYAYDAGGATAVGAAAVVRMVPAGLAAPLAGLLADRHPRRDVLLASLLARAALLVAMAGAVAAAAPVAVVLALAAVFTVVATAHKPAQAALLPALAETPSQLAASNAVWSGVDNAAFLFGALAGGALIATGTVEAAFMVTAGVYAVAALPVAGIRRDAVPPHRVADGGARRLSGAADGFRAVAANRSLRLVVGFLAASTLVEGAVDVLVVITALQLLDLGGAGVGWLNACWGLGGLIGGVAALALLGRGRLAAGLAAGGLLVGIPLMAIAGLLSAAVAGALLVLLGIGYALIEVAGLSLLQRLSSEDVLGRAFAVVESTYWITTGLGALAAPGIVALLGARGGLVAVGACLPLIVIGRFRALARLEAATPVPESEYRALRALPVFAPLPIATVENVARRVAAVTVSSGEVVIREGDLGDSFYVIAQGTFDVSAEDATLPSLGDGDYFGEIALLRHCARTATVTASSDALLYELDRDAFMTAVSSHPYVSESMAATATRRFARAHAS